MSTIWSCESYANVLLYICAESTPQVGHVTKKLAKVSMESQRCQWKSNVANGIVVLPIGMQWYQWNRKSANGIAKVPMESRKCYDNRKGKESGKGDEQLHCNVP